MDNDSHIVNRMKYLQWIWFVPLAFMVLTCLSVSGDQAETGGDRASTDSMISAVTVHVDGAYGREMEFETLARELIGLERGMVVDDNRFEAGLKALRDSDLFKEIDIPSPVREELGWHFTFHLTAYKRIKNIRIYNAFPLMERRVKSAIRLYVGDPFRAYQLDEKEKRLEDVYRKSGYPDPKVAISAKDVPDGVELTVRVTKGRYYSISEVDIDGNDSFSDFRLKFRTDTYKASWLVGDGTRYVENKLEADVKDLVRFYRRKGFADADVTSNVGVSESDRTVKIHLHVEEGPKYDFEFEGNTAFWNYTLKKEIDFVRRGNPGDTTLKRAVKSIRDKYRKAGYKNIYVGMQSENILRKGRNIRKVTFKVDEGPRSIVESMSFSGNEAIPDKTLKKQVLTRPKKLWESGALNPQVLNEDVEAMKILYRDMGFQNPEIETGLSWRNDEEQRLGTLTFDVKEGVKTVVASIRFDGLTVIPEDEAKLLIGLKEGAGFSKGRMNMDTITLSAAVSEKGYPRVTVKGSASVNDTMERAEVVYTVDQGSYIAMGTLVILGNFRTQRQIIENEMELLPGDPFSLAKFLASQKNIRDINALYGADFQDFGLVEKKDKVSLVVDVKEKKPFYIQAAAGYDTSRHGYLETKVGDRNLLGYNKEGWVSGELSEIGYRAETGLTEPRFLGTRISSTLNLYTKKEEELNKDFGTRTHGMSFHLSRDFWKDFTAGLQFRYEYRDQYQRDADVVPSEEVELYEGRRMVVTSPTLLYDSTDSFIRPKKGIFSSLGLDVSKALGDAPDEFLKYSYQANFYRSPLSFLTLALRFRYGFIYPTAGTTQIPDDQLFFLGGTASVRGFDENLLRYDLSGDPVGGRERVMWSVELRTDMPYNLELTTFFDTGRIGKTYTDEGSDQFRSSVGLGIRYLTPIGPIGFLYGFKLKPDEGEAIGQFHFTIGYSF